MTSPSDPRTASLYHAASGTAFSALGATTIVFASIGTLLVAGIVVALTGVNLMLAVGIGQLGLVAIPLVAMRTSGRDLRALGIRRPGLRFIAASVLIGISAWYLNLRIIELLAFPSDELQGLQQLVEQPSLGVVLVTIALAPAICEEILFRGVLTRGLATHFHPVVAIVMSAAMFSIYHLQPIQMLPTFTLGLMFGLVTLRSGSAFPTMLAHLLNNMIALLVSRGEAGGFPEWLDRQPEIALVLAIVLTASGLAIALASPNAGPAPTAPREIFGPRGPS